MTSSRTYELRQRAERQRETRRRIVEAAVDLHTTVGPSRTSVKAIAERAGVTRPTVYAHFPDERALFQACSGHVGETVPPPEASAWAAIADPGVRLETALGELYAYYERLETLFAHVERDALTMPVVAELNDQRLEYLDEVRELLLAGWGARGRAKARVRAAIGHTLEFGTWQSLVRRQGCRQSEAVELMGAFVAAAAP